MIRKVIAATCVFAILAISAPALAGGGHGHGGGNSFGHKHFRHGHRLFRHDGAAVFAGGLLLGALFGHLAAPPRTVYVAPPPQPALGNCRTIYGTSYLNGRLAEYYGTGCYDAYGNLYTIPGSERFLRYLVVGQFELSASRAMSSISHKVFVTPASIAGVTRNV